MDKKFKTEIIDIILNSNVSTIELSRKHKIDERTIRAWVEEANAFPPIEKMQKNIMSDNLQKAEKALMQASKYIHIYYFKEKNTILNFFKIEEEGYITNIPILENILDKWGKKLSSKVLVEIARACLTSLTQDYKAAVLVVNILIEREDIDAQKAFVQIFLDALSYYESGYRDFDDSVFDQLIENLFPKFNPSVLAILLKGCRTDVLSSGEDGDAMDDLFVDAFSQNNQIDNNNRNELIDKFVTYAKEMISFGRTNIIKSLQKRINDVNPEVGKEIDKQLT